MGSQQWKHFDLEKLTFWLVPFSFIVLIYYFASQLFVLLSFIACNYCLSSSLERNKNDLIWFNPGCTKTASFQGVKTFFIWFSKWSARIIRPIKRCYFTHSGCITWETSEFSANRNWSKHICKSPYLITIWKYEGAMMFWGSNAQTILQIWTESVHLSLTTLSECKIVWHNSYIVFYTDITLHSKSQKKRKTCFSKHS